MTDRELLEMAAKAAGIEIRKWGEPDYYSPRSGEVAYTNFGDFEWNPLTDDGDAFRLAVKLAITDLAITVGEYVCSGDYHDGDDICAITRRAIVRAAAEIGKAMP